MASILSRVLLILLLYITALPSDPIGEQTGEIRGTVIDENGQPLSKAKAHAVLMDGKPRSSAIRYQESDENGHFVIDRLEWGPYKVYAMKEAEGYPDSSFAFYSTNTSPAVILNSQAPIADVVVKIGPKAGRLRILSITDAVTGRDMVNVTGVDLRRTGIPSTFIGMGPSDHILIPADTDVTIKVEANGYEPWPPPNQLSLGQIRLASGQVLDLSVQLQPLSGLGAEIERMVRRAADANRLRLSGKKVIGPLPPPEEDIQRLRQLADQGIRALAQYLQPGKDPMEQTGATLLLANLGGDQSFDMIDEFARGEGDPFVRADALKWLAASKRPKDALLLQVISTSDPNPRFERQPSSSWRRNRISNSLLCWVIRLLSCHGSPAVIRVVQIRQ